TADDCAKPLPDPEAYLLALAELGVTARDALAVTGSVAGMRAATNAGLATTLIDSGAPMRDVSAAAAVHTRWWAAKVAKPLAA
ncbi:hypothetical protein ACN269_33875, partial [Micromonospora sp. WMMD736]